MVKPSSLGFLDVSTGAATAGRSATAAAFTEDAERQTLRGAPAQDSPIVSVSGPLRGANMAGHSAMAAAFTGDAERQILRGSSAQDSSFIRISLTSSLAMKLHQAKAAGALCSGSNLKTLNVLSLEVSCPCHCANVPMSCQDDWFQGQDSGGRDWTDLQALSP